jgi:hypothetical protein
MYLIRETPAIYNSCTKPLFIDKIDPKSIEWIQNILDCKKELELRVFENDLFMLQRDWKFNDRDIETLYCLALPK